MKCKLTGNEIAYDGVKMVCITPNGKEMISCYVSPRRWDRSECPHKHEFRTIYKINEYCNEVFADINKLQQEFQRKLPFGYTVKIYKDK